MGNDLLDTALCPREFAVETLLTGLELAESSAVELIRALQRGDAAGEESMLDAFGRLGQVGGDAKAAERLPEQRPLLEAEVLAQALGIADDIVLAQQRQVLGGALCGRAKCINAVRAAGASLIHEDNAIAL